MLNIWFYILFILNFIVFISQVIFNISSKKVREYFKQMRLLGNETARKNESTIKKYGWGGLIFLILIGAIYLAAVTSWIWVPIILLFTTNINTSLLWFSILHTLLSLIPLILLYQYTKNKKIKFPINFFLNEGITIMFFFQLYLLDSQNYFINLDNIIYSFLSNDIWYHVFFANLIAVLFLSLLATNSYFLIKRLIIIFNKKISITLIELVFVFIVSGILGIIYLQNINIDDYQLLKEQFYRNVSVIQMLFTAIIIPVFIKLFEKQVNRNKFDNEKDLETYIRERFKK
ncbi:hypothetical protein JV173_05110 [Acholeplasma equirhinis]|uniref:hypothetical protein n=1 Tax=Acholeplasma equirhinis TaxID=555393 RepID=UPI00197A9F1C|nr:hypothetical protein [Acholeplasma equirhinis]MBN3490892.1 hypothetical protein [Acholeplasma equirhinis]